MQMLLCMLSSKGGVAVEPLAPAQCRQLQCACCQTFALHTLVLQKSNTHGVIFIGWTTIWSWPGARIYWFAKLEMAPAGVMQRSMWFCASEADNDAPVVPTRALHVALKIGKTNVLVRNLLRTPVLELEATEIKTGNYRVVLLSCHMAAMRARNSMFHYHLLTP